MPGTTSSSPSYDTTAAIEAVRALADELTKMVGIARALVEAGREIDLTGFDRQVGLLCAKSLDLPAERRPSYPSTADRAVRLDGGAARVLAKRAPRSTDHCMPARPAKGRAMVISFTTILTAVAALAAVLALIWLAGRWRAFGGMAHRPPAAACSWCRTCWRSMRAAACI